MYIYHLILYVFLHFKDYHKDVAYVFCYMSLAMPSFAKVTMFLIILNETILLQSIEISN